MTTQPRRRWFRFGLRTMFVVVTIFSLVFGWHVQRVRERAHLLELARTLPLADSDFKVTPYLHTATEFQVTWANDRSEVLLAMAKENRGDGIFVLCRMLFEPRAGRDFARPEIGGAIFLGGTDYCDWPLEPIDLVDDVPFAITRGYILAGKAQEPEDYVRYCLANCVWTQRRYHVKTQAEKQAALTKLLSSSKWKTALGSDEQNYFSTQIE